MDLPSRVGRYEVELLLGEGGSGRVFLGRDPVLRRQVALKVLRDNLGLTRTQREELSERLRQEGCAASTLSHPVMVALHDMGDDPRMGLYLVFELVRGPTLRERLQEGPLPPAEVAHIARALASALTYAHSAGLVHRGVKPENVMLAPAGPKLTDFGISQYDPNAPAYSAPEVIASGTFGPPADQFSLAATMFEALTGRRAFPGEDQAEIGKAIVSGKHVAPRSALPRLRGLLRLDGVFARALAKDPKKRFPSCDAFGSALATELEGPRVTFLATPEPVRSSFARATRRWQNGVALGAVAVIFALLLIGRFHRAGVGDGVSPKSDGSAHAELRATKRGEGPEDKPRSSAQRVVAPSLRQPTPSSLPSASATSSASAGVSVLSSSIPRVDP